MINNILPHYIHHAVLLNSGLNDNVQKNNRFETSQKEAFVPPYKIDLKEMAKAINLEELNKSEEA